MRIIKSAIDNIENIEDFAKSASGPMPFKTKASHALVRKPTDDKWDDQITNLLSDYVADLVFDRIHLHNTLKIRDSIDFLLRKPDARPGVGSCLRGLCTAHFAIASNLSLRPWIIKRLLYSSGVRKPNPKQGAISTR